ncbi:DsbE family thiol:disulfide interchange protein [Oricola indica]|jgi:cytochrome c biogenesis protein CcmG/thiol:disulfide interchange protein DsbE|uniref:DsbE family thiol:disulfide interchange protein n=1 Tax=Oricola indica TaxID=2872591 RepID=UPI000C8DC270|nr:DsbE family thiol:disulfide interchange protein [Ahrensia sp.]
MARLLASLPFFIALFLGIFFLWGLNPDRDPNEIPSVLIAQPVPEFQLEAIEGLSVPGLARSDLVNASQPIVVNVFASWCVPCRAEHRVLTDLVEREGIRLFGINYKDQPADAVRWLSELGNPYERIGSDLTGRAGIEWGISGVPETFIVGETGTVLYRYVGPIIGDEAVRKIGTVLKQAGAFASE